MKLIGTYAGVVENAHDPEKLGRMKARVPHVHGVNGSGAGFIATNELPWALPAGMPNGGSGSSGGFSHLPTIGDHVWVRFLDGEPEKPIWEWGMQTFSDRDRMKVHHYADTAGKVGNPDSAFWTRYGHAVEISQSGIIMTTSKGYRVEIVDGQPVDGSVEIATNLGNTFSLDDLDNGARLQVNLDYHLNIGDSLIGLSDFFSWVTMTGDFTVEAGSGISLTAIDGISITTAGNLLLDGMGTVQLGGLSNVSLDLMSDLVRLGSPAATEPLVLGNSFVLWVELLLVYLSTHTHSNGNLGSPTGPPIVPPTLPPGSSMISETVFTS